MTATVRGNRSGSLLIITLWLVTILSVLAVAVARYLSLEVKVTKYALAREQAGALARSGVYLAMQRLMEDAKEAPAVDWLSDDWALPEDPLATARGEVRISISDEERKLDINAASEEALTALSGSAGAAKAIVDYRDEPEAGEERPPYYPKNEPVSTVEELHEIPEIAQAGPEVFATLARETSPYLEGKPENGNTASREVLLALGLSAYTADKIEEFRAGPDGPDAHEQDGTFEETAAIVPTLQAPPTNWKIADTAQDQKEQAILGTLGVVSNTFTVTAEGRVNHPDVHERVEAVILRGGCASRVPAGAPVLEACIIAWRQG